MDTIKESLQLAIFQTNIVWEEVDTNLHQLDKMVSALDKDVDIIVLPEMFSTGFTMNPEKLVQKDAGKSLQWLLKLAQNQNAVVIASIPNQYKEEYYNTLYFVQPNGVYHQYHKKHLFTLAKENKHYTKGKQKLIVTYKGWKICPLICYDLRFPIFSRNLEDYDLLIYVANWPDKRILAWNTLLRARAIENMSFTVGVNRVGAEAGNLYNGYSQVIDTLGEYLLPPQHQEGIFYAQIHKKTQDTLRKKLGFLQDRDNDLVLKM